MEKTFEKFDNGVLRLPLSQKNFAAIPWSEHPTFEGVALKHLVTSADTDGKFSCHLVRIAPNKKIQNHIHATQLEIHEVIEGDGICINGGTELSYETGVISIIDAAVPHEVTAGENGLYMFAKFIPPLC